MKRKRIPRQTRITTLIVVEGYAEKFFVDHLISQYVVRGEHSKPTVKNAQGKGGAYVLKTAINLKAYASYDHVYVILDTDINWGSKEKLLAKKEKITVIENTPCFEVFLLEILGIKVRGSTEEMKKRFLKQCGAEAHKDGIISKFFTREVLDKARQDVEKLDKLINILTNRN